MTDTSFRDLDQRIENMLRPRAGGASARIAEPLESDAAAPGDQLSHRIARLEAEVADLRATMHRLEPKLDVVAGFVQTGAAHLVSNAELAATEGRIREKLAEKPGFAYMWLVVALLTGAIVAAFATGIAVLHIVR
ncbi:MAG: hypothetical protein JNL66_00825 [Alphaproteobacteria bacterium]|nr:hypothetical protein [Alphaproteobacteria bacterium]